VGKPSHPQITKAGAELAEDLLAAHELGRNLVFVFERIYEHGETLRDAGLETRVVFEDNPTLQAAWARWHDDKRGIGELVPPVLRRVSG
jgi:hypothetical protein